MGPVGALSTLPAAKALTSARHTIVSQTVLIIVCPEIHISDVTSVSISAVKGQDTVDHKDCTQIAGCG